MNSLSLINSSKNLEVFKVTGQGRDKDTIFKIDQDYKGNKPIKNYHTKGSMQLIPDSHDRFTMFIYGQSGSGKSYYCAQVLKEYLKLNNKNFIYLVSPKPKKEDPAFENIKNMEQLAINYENFVDEDTKFDDLHDFENTCLVFDDVEGITDKKIKQGVYAFIKKILVLGRSLKVSCITILHRAMAGAETAYIISESRYFVVFPKSGTDTQIERLLNTYAGMKKDQIIKLLNLNTRAVAVHKQKPQYVLAEHNFYFY